MTTSAGIESAQLLERRRSERLVMVAYTAAISTSAFLLFLVQPMAAKAMLPHFGGAPAVWIVAMLFFQAALLAGYLFVHVGSTRLGAARYRALHLGVLALAALTLPVGMRVVPPLEQAAPTAWVMLMLLLGVGAPFFALSTSSPALQRWFSLTGHRRAGDPYFLYVASNAGSLAALLAYPLVVERFLSLDAQETLWSAAFVGLIALTAGCSLFLRREPAVQVRRPGVAVGSWRERAQWTALAFIPSGLMLGVTSYISSEIAAVPLFWVAPLAVYLITFMLAFSARRRPVAWTARAVPVVALLALPAFLPGIFPAWFVIGAHLGVLLLAGTAIHGRLAEKRPAPERLPEFYVYLSLGGVLGAVFAALLAPHLFIVVIEYPLFFWLAVLASRSVARVPWGRAAVLQMLLALGLLAALSAGLVETGRLGATAVFASLPGIAVMGALLVAARRAAISFVIAAALACVLLAYQSSDIYSERTFFGTLRVKEAAGSTERLLIHGTTAHGVQEVRADRRRVPLSYYARSGPLGDVFARHGESVDQVGAIGLGVGTLAAYGQPGQRFTFFELDPAVAAIAQNPTLFTYLRDSRADVRVVVGDGRLLTDRVADGTFDLLVVDAFNSDAIPTHLLTREALALYARKLSPGGLVAFHLSSRYFELSPVVAASAARLRLVAAERNDSAAGAEAEKGKAPSIWVVVGRDRSSVAPLLESGRWRLLRGEGNGWTDAFTNPLSALDWSGAFSSS